MRKTHKDVQFAVEVADTLEEKVFKTFEEALVHAVFLSVTGRAGAKPVYVDVLVSSRSGARWWAGEDGVDEYNEDPEASVFDRIVIRADSEGRVP